MTTFSEIWSTDVKPLASACVEEARIVQLIGLGENYKPNQEEKEYINSVSGMYKDCYGMYYISEMIRKVDDDLAENREAQAILEVNYVYRILNNQKYFNDVFGGNKDNEEWKKRVALKNGIERLFNLYA